MPDRPQTPPLADDFKASTQAEWQALAARSAGGALDGLVSLTRDGIAVGPLESGDDGTDAVPVPAIAAGGAEIRPLIAEPTPEAANAAIRTEIEGGAREVVLQIEAPGQAGIRLGQPGLERVLEGIAPDSIAIHLRHPAAPDHCQSALVAWWEAGTPPQDRRGGFGIDTIGAAASGALDPARLGADGLAWDAGILAGAIAQAPHASVLTASGLLFHEAGASEAQELAAMLAAGAAYLRACEGHGIDLKDAAARIALELAADADIFLTVAKLRAARLLWARVLELCGVGDGAVRLDVQTSARMMCAADPRVNMLRVTAAAFAAGVGGADALTVLPYTHAIGRPDSLARRIARNTGLILAEESAIGRVGDAAAGSWTIERLTGALCERGWALLREIEAEGGIIASLACGALQRRIGAVRETRARDIAAGKSVLVGTGDYAPGEPVMLEAEPWAVPTPLSEASALRPISLEPGRAA